MQDNERLQLPEGVKDPRKSKYEQELDDRVASLERAYLQAFQERWGSSPVVSKDDRDALRVVAVKHKCRPYQLMKGYLDLKDDYIANAGYPLKFLPSRINKILIEDSSEKEKKAYVIAYTYDGRDFFAPVLDSDPNRLLKTSQYLKPIEIGVWRRLTLQFPKKEKVGGGSGEFIDIDPVYEGIENGRDPLLRNRFHQIHADYVEGARGE